MFSEGGATHGRSYTFYNEEGAAIAEGSLHPERERFHGRQVDADHFYIGPPTRLHAYQGRYYQVLLLDLSGIWMMLKRQTKL